MNKKYKKLFKWLGLSLLTIFLVIGVLYFIYLRPFMQKMKITNVIQYDKELTLVTGGGGNSGILVSDSLVIVIDTKMDDAAVALDDQVKKLAGNKPILVVNTHFHPDHIGGNKFYKGNTIYAGADYTKEDWIKEAGEESLPDSWLKNKLDIKMGNDTVSIFNLAKNVHTQSDIVVYLHNRKLLFAGDIVLNKQAPIIMGKGNPYGYLWAFDWFINTLDINTVVPGHGEIGGKELITNYKAYFEDMKTASFDESQKESLSSKYENWGQLPLVMSPAATIKAFKKNEIN